MDPITLRQATMRTKGCGLFRGGPKYSRMSIVDRPNPASDFVHVDTGRVRTRGSSTEKLAPPHAWRARRSRHCRESRRRAPCGTQLHVRRRRQMVNQVGELLARKCGVGPSSARGEPTIGCVDLPRRTFPRGEGRVTYSEAPELRAASRFRFRIQRTPAVLAGGCPVDWQWVQLVCLPICKMPDQFTTHAARTPCCEG